MCDTQCFTLYSLTIGIISGSNTAEKTRPIIIISHRREFYSSYSIRG